jgi:hypothetical protein
MITVAYRNTRRLVLEMPLLIPTLEPRLQVADAAQDQRHQNASEDVQQSGHNLSVAYALQLARCTGAAAATRVKNPPPDVAATTPRPASPRL